MFGEQCPHVVPVRGVHHIGRVASPPMRMAALGQIVHHLSDQIPSLGLFYVVDSTIYSRKITGMTRRTQESTQAWNAEEWDVV